MLAKLKQFKYFIKNKFTLQKISEITDVFIGDWDFQNWICNGKKKVHATNGGLHSLSKDLD